MVAGRDGSGVRERRAGERGAGYRASGSERASLGQSTSAFSRDGSHSQPLASPPTVLLIRILTAAALFSLLFTTGLRLSLREIHGAVLLGRRFLRLAGLQFGVIPILTVLAARVFRVPPEVSMAMLLLAASPFAPVVPVFARMARGDLAMAAGLTAVFPILCSVLTPPVCWAGALFLPPVGDLRFEVVPILATLWMTAPLPLVLGLWMRARFPEVAARIVGPIDLVAQAIGTVSLAYVVVSGFQAILSIDWIGLVAMTMVAEMALALGWFWERGARGTRIVLGLGSANRNIALALLIAADSFPGTAIVPGVASLGLLLLTLGLLHVGFWRWRAPHFPG